MTRLTKLSTMALTVGLCAAPAAAQQTQQQQQNTGQTQQQELVKPQLSQQGQACVDRLETADRELAELGYGRVGPGGYGVYGTAYQPPAPSPAGRSDAFRRPLQATPRADMYALMRAGYVLARTGHDEACQQVAQTVEEIGGNYRQAMRDQGADGDGMTQWREAFVASAVPVQQLEQPLRFDEIVGSDLRNLRDEDLGDIDDLVVGPHGQINYAIVSRGGFLGFGGDQVPVPWDQLRVTAAPYRDTFVLDVSEQAVDEAPTLEDGERRQLADGQLGQRVDSFWQNQLSGGQ